MKRKKYITTDKHPDIGRGMLIPEYVVDISLKYWLSKGWIDRIYTSDELIEFAKICQESEIEVPEYYYNEQLKEFDK